MVVFLFYRNDRWEVHQKPEEIPTAFVLGLVGGLQLYSQDGKRLSPDVEESASETTLRLYWLRNEDIWTVGVDGRKVLLRGGLRDERCTVVGTAFLTAFPKPDGCALGPPTSRDKAQAQDRWERLLDPVV